MHIHTYVASEDEHDMEIRQTDTTTLHTAQMCAIHCPKVLEELKVECVKTNVNKRIRQLLFQRAFLYYHDYYVCDVIRRYAIQIAY